MGLLERGAVDLCFCNEDEAVELAGGAEGSPEAGLDWLAARTNRLAVVTLGEKGCMVKERGADDVVAMPACAGVKVGGRAVLRPGAALQCPASAVTAGARHVHAQPGTPSANAAAVPSGAHVLLRLPLLAARRWWTRQARATYLPQVGGPSALLTPVSSMCPALRLASPAAPPWRAGTH